MKVRMTIALALIAICAHGALAEKKAATPAAARFDALKKLAGDWVQVSEDGKPGNVVASRIKVTAGGTAIVETVFPGQDHEMVTVYTVDGNDLVLTHYCVLGNQPRMKADAGKDVNRIAFNFTGGGNLKSESDNHMHNATITIVDADHFNAEWCACEAGKETHRAAFKLVRKK